MIKQITYQLVLLLCSFHLMAQLSPGKLSQAHSHLEGLSNCTQCHTLGENVTNQKCLDCHKEINTLIDNERGFHASSEVQGKQCVACHSEHHGLQFDATKFDEEKFDHDLTGYKLEGKHDEIECRECHKPAFIAEPEIKKLENTFLGMEQECLSCHEDFHQETMGSSCIDCHGFNEWRPAPGFDHDEAKFVLKGAHKEVDCKECHAITTRNGKEFQEFVGLKFEQCIDCHEDVHKGKFGINCLECHNENTFTLTSTPKGFNHDLTDYPLEGLHKQVECKECHTSGNNTDPLRHNLCKDCHEDYHNGEFVENGKSPDCKACHTLSQRFDFTLYGLEEHNKSQFVLEGGHIATPCFACHLDESDERWAFRNIGERCVDCHENIHKGFIADEFMPNEDCSACHEVLTWKQPTFDHEKTDWPLEGKHKEVDCRSCHFRDESVPDFGQQFADLGTDCFTCHENVHGDQFGATGTFACTNCHSTSSEWNIDAFDHDKTEFPLDGRHKEVDCSGCHKPALIDGEERIEYKIQKFECIDCHS